MSAKDILLFYPDVVNEVLKVTNEKSKCLELGCGAGNYSLEFARNKRDTIASDISPNALRITKIKGKKLGFMPSRLQKIDAYSIPYKDNTFDVIFSDGVLEHLDIPKVMKEIRRALKRGGWLISKVPSNRILYKLVHFIMSKERSELGCVEEKRYSEKEWINFLKAAGFKNAKVRMCGNLSLALQRRLFNGQERIPMDFGKIYFLMKAQK